MATTAQDLQSTAAPSPTSGARRYPSRHPDVVAFREAVVALAASIPDSDDARHHAADAGRRLVVLGDAGDADALRLLLRPDPSVPAVAWTVACYQIGDLTPSALRDFADPVEAVTTLVHCGEASHLAAELVASTDDGLRWTSVIRTGDLLRFQLLGSATCVADAQGTRLAAAEREWEAQLLRWAVGDEPAPEDVPGLPAVAVAASGEAQAAPAPNVLEALVEQVLSTLRTAERPPEPPAPEILDRLAAIEGRLDDITRALDGLRRDNRQLALASWWQRVPRLAALRATFELHIRGDAPARPVGHAAAIDTTAND
ncbi:hypothetical protein K6U06_16840 [Acidiferrimicrobium sp. IK]|uniref:hypothetical protein n=1 Tax=Acidiferrimicrobium sp. IK TaxID=2871700 RepID=UPI0021CB16A5|nr:hypothetical protein [Acidiferrimicrobium sp. IK]MCU4186038.1 hypothetical protein [Acidiferrimicrobium sp. IK]